MHTTVITEKEIIEFLATETSTRSTKLSLSSQLGNLVDGDAAVELMEAFAKRFGVDLTGLNYSKYFGPEAPFSPFSLLDPSWWEQRRSLKPITVSHLLRCANEGVWQDVP
jgi:hypothetical protein